MLCHALLDMIFHWILVRYLHIIDTSSSNSFGSRYLRCCLPFSCLWHSYARTPGDFFPWCIPLPIYADISMALFNSLMSTRIGEAANPGPAQNVAGTINSVSLTVLNPTALYGKTNELLAIGADCYLCSETSSTSLAQSKISKEFSSFGYRCFWSCPVANKKDTLDDRPSLRGEAGGSAVISRLPSRKLRNQILSTLWNTCRVSTAIIQLQYMEVLVISVYGFTANRTHESYRANDTLFAYVYDLAVQANMPFIIGGDFNTQISSLPCFRLFQQLGVVEAFHLNQCKFGFQLPPTCNGVTRNDTYLFHPLIAQRVVEIKVQMEHTFEPHVPISVVLDLSMKIQKPLKWDIPKSWVEFGPLVDNIASAYEFTRKNIDISISPANDKDIEQLFLDWSQSVEQAVDYALRWQHQLDPVANPVSSLPKTHRGRCSPRRLVSPHENFSPGGDRFGGYNPKYEIFSLRCRHKVRQTRRIASLIRAFKSALVNHGPLHPCHPCWRQLCHEWLAILKAPGYGNAWYKWILAFEVVPCVSQNLPSLEELDVMYQITKCDVDVTCQQEHANRHRKFKYHIRLDNSQGFAKTTYKILKSQSPNTLDELPNTLDELPYQITTSASLCRHQKRSGDDLQKLLLDQDCQFLLHQTARFGDADIMICHQQGKRVSFRILRGVVPVRANLTQSRVAVTPEDMFPIFHEFWSPMWLRDSLEEVHDSSSWDSFQDELNMCDFPDMAIDLDLSSIHIWRDAINKLKRGKATGVCGWSYEDFRTLPDAALDDLASICAKCWVLGLPASMMRARVALLAKNDNPTSIHHGRPITIMSCISRLISKVVYDQVASQWSKHLPLPISGGLPGRGVRDLGVPEGDCISVLVMIGFSSVFYYRLSNPRLKPFAYADNWSWLSSTTRDNFSAFIKVLNLTSSCKMIVDINKSWLWATDPNMRKSITNVNALFPGQQVIIPIKSHAKDLGEIVQYGKCRFASPMIDRVKEACKKLEKLKWLPITLECKVLRVQAAIWSLALYGSDLHYLGMHHFHKLRQAVSRCLVGNHQQTNPWLTCLLIGKRLDDPLLHTFLSACRCIRRLSRIDLTVAQAFVQDVLAFSGDIPFGPASSFAKYLSQLGLSLHISGSISYGQQLLFNLLEDSSNYIAMALREWWPSFVLGQVGHRKGLEHGHFDFQLTRDVFQSFSDQDQKILLLNMVGGYRSGTHKNIWTSDHSDVCEFCGMIDDRRHRFLQCPAFQNIRDNHCRAVALLSHSRGGWMYHPFAWKYHHIDFLKAFLDSIPLDPIPVVHTEHSSSLVFFTDGGCENPTNIVSRKSSWSVVVDRYDSCHDRVCGAEMFRYHECKHPCLEVLATGITPGPQSAARGELFALLQAARYASSIPKCLKASFVVDAQYVINIVQAIENDKLMVDKVHNSDLVRHLHQVWDSNKFSIEKIKSHLNPKEADNLYQMWKMLGNNCADQAATAALSAIPSEIGQLFRQVQQFIQQEKQDLTQVLQFFVELNRSRSLMLDTQRKHVSTLDSSASDSIFQTLLAHKCHRSICFLHGDLDPVIAAANLQGTRLAYTIWEWAKQLRWPENIEEDIHSNIGVSWLELLMNFYLTTKMLPPVRTHGQGATSCYRDYFHQDVIILPVSKRSFGSFSFTFQAAVRGLTSILGQSLWPASSSNFVSSLARLGFKGKQSGLATRPEMPNTALTLHFLQQYIKSIGDAKSAHLPLQSLDGGDIIDFPCPEEIAADERYKNYLRLVKRRR